MILTALNLTPKDKPVSKAQERLLLKLLIATHRPQADIVPESMLLNSVSIDSPSTSTLVIVLNTNRHYRQFYSLIERRFEATSHGLSRTGTKAAVVAGR